MDTRGRSLHLGEQAHGRLSKGQIDGNVVRLRGGGWRHVWLRCCREAGRDLQRQGSAPRSRPRRRTPASADARWLHQDAQGKQISEFPRIDSAITAVRPNADRATSKGPRRRQHRQCSGLHARARRRLGCVANPYRFGPLELGGILPHFIAQEGNAKFNDEFHGTDGPMLVSDPGYICEMSQIYVRAAQRPA